MSRKKATVTKKEIATIANTKQDATEEFSLDNIENVNSDTLKLSIQNREQKDYCFNILKGLFEDLGNQQKLIDKRQLHIVSLMEILRELQFDGEEEIVDNNSSDYSNEVIETRISAKDKTETEKPKAKPKAVIKKQQAKQKEPEPEPEPEEQEQEEEPEPEPIVTPIKKATNKKPKQEPEKEPEPVVTPVKKTPVKKTLAKKQDTEEIEIPKVATTKAGPKKTTTNKK